MYLEYDWTFSVYRPRFGHVFTAIRDQRFFETLGDARAALVVAGLRLGPKTDSRTWKIELAD